MSKGDGIVLFVITDRDVISYYEEPYGDWEDKEDDLDWDKLDPDLQDRLLRSVDVALNNSGMSETAYDIIHYTLEDGLGIPGDSV